MTGIRPEDRAEARRTGTAGDAYVPFDHIPLLERERLRNAMLENGRNPTTGKIEDAYGAFLMGNVPKYMQLLGRSEPPSADRTFPDVELEHNTGFRPRDWRFEELDRAVQVSAGLSATDAAKVLRVARETGFTTNFVRDNLATIEAEQAKGSFDARTFARTSPLVSEWLAKDPARVALMGEDLTRMGVVERQTRNIVERFRMGRRQTELLRIGEAALAGTATPEQRERQRQLEVEMRQAPDFGFEGFFGGAPGAAAEQLPILGRTLKAAGAGGAAGAVVGAGVAVIAGQLGPQAATPEEAVTVPAAARFGAGVFAKTAVAYDVAVMEASGAYLDYERLEGLDAETARGAALIAGALAGSLELLSLKALAKVTPGLRNLSRSGVRSALTNPATRDILMRIAKDIGVSAATEGVTETLQSLITQGGGTIAQAAQDGRLESDLGGVLGEVFGPEAVKQALAEGRTGAQSALFLAGGGGSISAVQDIRAAHQAERQAESIRTLADAGGDAVTTGTAPREVEDLVTELQQSGLSGFSYDAAAWRTYWQSVVDERGTAIDPAAVVSELVGDVKAYETAIETGGTFEVPLGAWVSKLARNPEVRAWAVENAKVGPGAMSAVEATAAQKGQEEGLQGILDTMVETKAEAVPVDEAATALRERVVREVRAAGRPVREAERAGELWASVYRTWAAESGTSAEDLAAMFERVRITPQQPAAEVATEVATPTQRALEQGAIPRFEAESDTAYEARRQRVFARAAALGGQVVTGETELQRLVEGSSEAALRDLVTALRTDVEGLSPFGETEVRMLEQAASEGPRGRIRFAQSGRVSVDLFSSADASTFLHESAHLFLAFQKQLAAAEGATDRIKADYAVTLEWLGAAAGETLTVEQEERFARGFEAYLMEGQAPSLSLRSAFASFAAWLTRLYRQAVNLKVEITPEIRRVFDRMLATDAAIQEAQDANVREPLFMGEAVMPEAEAAQYRDALVQAQERATETLRTEVLSVIAREEKAWFKARREELEPEVRAEAYADPAYRARSILQTGALPDGTPLPDGDPLLQKLDRAGVVAIIGEEGLKLLPRAHRGATAVYRDGGLNPEVAAGALNYGEALTMLRALQGTIPIEREIRRRTEARLREEFGDPLTDGRLPERAMDAIHTAERDRVIQLELEELQRRSPATVRALLRRFGGRIPVTADIQRQADAMLAGRTIRSIRPIEFQRAEVKAAKDAIAAAVKGDWTAAAEAKIRERLSLALYRAAVSALQEVDKAQNRYVRYFRADDVLGKTRDLNLVNGARAVLARVGMGRAAKSPADYLKSVRQYDPELAAELESLLDTNIPPREDSRDLTLAEFRMTDEQATALWDQSKRTRQMVIDGKRMDRTAIVDALAAELAAMPDRMKGAGRAKAFTATDSVRKHLLGFEAALRRTESWVDQMDGGNPNGIFRRYMWTPISEASARFRLGKRDVTNRYLALLEPMRARLSKPGPIGAPEIGYTFRDRQELLGAMLHTGNASNLDKLTRGRGWDPAAWQSFVSRLWRDGTLTAEDYGFLQGVWDLFESLKPEAQRVHKDLLGYYFDEITAAPIETPFGTFQGGYVPALADTMLAEDARIRSERAEQEGVNPSTMFPSVGRGFTKGRVEEYARPLVMDLRLIRSHIDAVTRFVHLAQPTRDAGRLFTDRRFRAALSEVDPEMGSELTAWAQRAGSQAISTPSRGPGGRGVDTAFRWLRSNTGLSLMALNVSVTLQQFTGLSIAAVKVKPKYLRNALWQTVRAPRETAAAIAERSTYMATRVSASVLDVERRIDNLIANPTKFEQAKAFAQEHGYILQATTQGLVDSVVWQGAFDQATARGATEQEAIREADSAVRLTQGSFAPEDVSRMETGSPFVRTFMMFYGYFNMQANLLLSEFAQVVRQSGLRKGAGRLLYVYVLGFMIPAVVGRMVIEVLAGGPDDDDDDGMLDEWMSVFFASQVQTAFALVPGGNLVTQAFINQFNDKWYDDRVSVSPAVSTIESAGRGAKDVLYDWWAEGEVKRRDIRDVLTLFSLLTGLPLVSLARPGSYLYDVQQGTATPDDALDFTRGLVSGRP